MTHALLFLFLFISIFQLNADGQSSLHLSIQRGNIAIVALLLNAHATLEILNMQKFSPFFFAVWHNKYDISR